jgi:ribonuclease E
VQLKSGGYIVIDVTEALVAIDVNSGRATREASIEDTALKTNLEAAEEAARQMRLRDLAGLIVIDFIDMEDRKNNAAVEKRLKDKLKTDRARIQMGRISGFGLMEMSRQRLRPGMIEATTKSCPHCHGTGRVRSDDSMALALLREIEEEGVRQRSKEVLIVAPVEIANYLLNQKREHVATIEQRFGLSVRVEGDRSLVSPDFRIERFKAASRIIPAAQSLDLPKVAYPDEDEIEADLEVEVEEEDEEETAAEGAEADGASGAEKSNGKRRRRRRRRGGARPEGEASDRPADVEAPAEPVAADAAPEVEPMPAAPEAPAPAERSRSRRRSRGNATEDGSRRRLAVRRGDRRRGLAARAGGGSGGERPPAPRQAARAGPGRRRDRPGRRRPGPARARSRPRGRSRRGGSACGRGGPVRDPRGPAPERPEAAEDPARTGGAGRTRARGRARGGHGRACRTRRRGRPRRDRSGRRAGACRGRSGGAASVRTGGGGQT